MSGSVTAQQIAEFTGKNKSAITRRAQKEGWPAESKSTRGGKQHSYLISDLPADIQRAVCKNLDSVSCAMLPALTPEAAIIASEKIIDHQPPVISRRFAGAGWQKEPIPIEVIRDPRVRRIAKIVQEALEVPAGWRKRRWTEAVAVKYDTSYQTIYKWIKKYEKKGLSGLQHIKCNRGEPRAWSPEAIDWWIGLCLKREHRRMAKDAVYDMLCSEAETRGWAIGGYESALDWINRRITPQLTALQRGGVRALDNAMPPVLRDYSDLAPFEILVGDQHRFDFWVTDEGTGEVFRPEGYFWQDLRTRLFYGGAIDRKYDSFLMGLALRFGIRIWGAFGSIYTDWGKPETGRYIMSILSDMRVLGLNAERDLDVPVDISETAAEEVNPFTIAPGTHKRAIVRNAKAKMIEGTFNVLEGLLRDHMKVPGYAKRLSDESEWQDIDQAEIERLAAAGKLLTYSEFVVRVFEAMDYYNKEKHHRGVYREWSWMPKPKKTVPLDALKMAYLSGWQPREIRPEEADIVFLPQADRGGRMVDRGRVSFKNGPYQLYEHDALIPLHGKRVELRYDPMDPEWVLCFNKSGFVCEARPVEYSSMKNIELASRKIAEKASLRKAVIAEYRRYTENIPDFLQYSAIPKSDKPAAITGPGKRAQIELRSEAKPQTADELARDIAAIENYQYRDRPIFTSEVDRYQWCVTEQVQRHPVSDSDVAFMAEFESRMDKGTLNYWAIYRDSIGGNGL